MPSWCAIQNLKWRVLRQAERRYAGRCGAWRACCRGQRQYFDGKLRWTEIKYVTNQQTLLFW